jgi:hypothetical protein
VCDCENCFPLEKEKKRKGDERKREREEEREILSHNLHFLRTVGGARSSGRRQGEM